MAKSKKSELQLSIFDYGHLPSEKRQPERHSQFGDPVAEFPKEYAERGPLQEKGTTMAVVAVGSCPKWMTADAEREALIVEREASLSRLAKRDKVAIAQHVVSGDDGEEKIENVYVPGQQIVDWYRAQEAKLANGYAPNERGISNYRRGESMIANAYAFCHFGDGKRTLAQFKVPAVRQIVPDDLSPREFERWEADIRIDENRQPGLVGYDDCAWTRIVYRDILEFGLTPKQVEHRRFPGVKGAWGKARRYSSIAKLAKAHKKLNLLDRFEMDAPTDAKGKALNDKYEADGYVPIKKIQQPLLDCLAGGSGTVPAEVEAAFKQVAKEQLAALKAAKKPDKEAIAEAEARVKAGRPEEYVATSDVVERTIKLLIEGSVREPKMLAKSDLQERIKGVNPESAAHDLIKSVLSGDKVKVEKAIGQIEKLEDSDDKAALAQAESKIADLESKILDLRKQIASLEKRVAPQPATSKPTTSKSKKATSK